MLRRAKILLKGILVAAGAKWIWDRWRRIKNSYYYRNKELTNPGDYNSIRCNDYYKCIFIHVPKAAGVSLNLALFGNYGGAHKPLTFYEDYYHSSSFRSYFKFTFVRNPYSRLLSAFNYMKAGGTNRWDQEFAEKHLGNHDFKSFVMEWLNEVSMEQSAHFRKQVDFIKLSNGKIGLDYVGKFEQIAEDYNTIARKLNIDRKLQHRNKGKKESASILESYSQEMKEKAYRLYYEDFQLLGYDKNFEEVHL